MKLRNRQPRREPRPKAVEAAAPQPEQPVRVFNPEMEISNDNWEMMKQELESYRGSDWWAFSAMACSLITVFPDRREELELDDSYMDILNELNEARFIEHGSFVGIAVAFITFFPDRRNELNLDERTYTWIRQAIQKDTVSMSRIFTTGLTELMIMFPEKRNEFDLNDDEFNGRLESMELMRESNEWLHFAEYASELAVLFPDRKVELNIDSKSLAGMRAGLEPDADSIWWPSADMAMHLAIITADEVRITGQGLEIVNSSKLITPSELPNRNLVA